MVKHFEKVKRNTYNSSGYTIDVANKHGLVWAHL